MWQMAENQKGAGTGWGEPEFAAVKAALQKGDLLGPALARFDLAALYDLWDEMAQRMGRAFQQAALEYLSACYGSEEGTFFIYRPSVHKIDESADRFYEDAAECYIAGTLFEAAAFRPKDLEKQELLTLHDGFVHLTMQYMRMAYAPQMLTDHGVRLLARRERFVYASYSAQEAKENGDFHRFEACLAAAVGWYPPMAHTAALLLADYERENTRRQELLEQKEFQMYAQTIKENLWYLIDNGRYEEAEVLLASYESLNPSDLEILDFRRELGMEETLPPLN